MNLNSGPGQAIPSTTIPATFAVPSKCLQPEEVKCECSNIFINGNPIPCVRELNLKQRYGDNSLDLSLQFPYKTKIEYKEGSYYITTERPVRLSKEQLRKLILDNIDDNLEAVSLVNEFKLSEQESK